MASISTQASAAAAAATAAAATASVKYVPPTMHENLKSIRPEDALLKPGCQWNSNYVTYKHFAEILLRTKLFAPEGEATYPKPSDNVMPEAQFLQIVADVMDLRSFLNGISQEDALAFEIAFNLSYDFCRNNFDPRKIKNPRIAAAFKARVLTEGYQKWFNESAACNATCNNFRSFVYELVKQNAPLPATDATLATFTQMQKEIDELKQALERERTAAMADRKAAHDAFVANREALHCAQLREGKLRDAIAAIAGQLSASN